MTLTELLIAELPLKVLLASLHDYIGERQAEMIKEIVAVNELSEDETKSLIKEYIK
jgi:polyhydroxyalkanoate synthesis regulator phasin